MPNAVPLSILPSKQVRAFKLKYLKCLLNNCWVWGGPNGQIVGFEADPAVTLDNPRQPKGYLWYIPSEDAAFAKTVVYAVLFTTTTLFI